MKKQITVLCAALLCLLAAFARGGGPGPDDHRSLLHH